jgi:ketosteroid isomerase-like protein
MSDIEGVKAAIDRWLSCLDRGDLEGMLDCCDPDVVIANERQPTTVGVAHVREKYAPRLEQFTTKSSFEPEHVAVYGDFAIVVGHFEVNATEKASGGAKTATGRLALNYRKDASGAWKMILDIDNN